MSANAIDLCLAETVAGDLGVTSDATVQRVVTAASRAIANYCGRAFELAEAIVEYPPSFARPFLVLKRSPIVSIASIYERDALVTATDYESIGDHAAAGIVHRKIGRWMRTARDTGNIGTNWTDYAGETGSRGVKVTYDAGWVTPGQKALDDTLTVTLPEDVQEAAVIAAVAFYRRRGVDPSVASEQLGDWSVSYRGGNTVIGLTSGGLPDTALQLLAPYVQIPVL